LPPEYLRGFVGDDLSDLQGVVSDEKNINDGSNRDTELENLPALVPDVKASRRSTAVAGTVEEGSQVLTLMMLLAHYTTIVETEETNAKDAHALGCESTSAKSLSLQSNQNEVADRSGSMKALLD
jgi:maltooligosyltrehalose synthase